MTFRERVFKFGSGVGLLWNDFQLYRNIRDASTTPRNAWTIENKRLEIPSSVVASQVIRSRIPWRQQEQQRRFIDGLFTVFPVVALWAIPVVGYIPMFVAIATPRQLLSRHFLLCSL